MKQVANLIAFMPPPETKIKPAVAHAPKGFGQVLNQSLTSTKEQEPEKPPVQHMMSKLGASPRVANAQGKPKARDAEPTIQLDQQTKTTEEGQSTAHSQQKEVQGITEEIRKELSSGNLTKEDLAKINELLAKMADGTELAKIMAALQALLGQAGATTTSETSQVAGQGEQLGDLLKLVQQLANYQKESQQSLLPQTLMDQVQILLKKLVNSDGKLVVNNLETQDKEDFLKNLLQQIRTALSSTTNQLTEQIQQLQARLGPAAPLVKGLAQLVQETQQVFEMVVKDGGNKSIPQGAALVKLEALLTGLTQKTTSLQQTAKQMMLPKLEVVTSGSAQTLSDAMGANAEPAEVSEEVNQADDKAKASETHAGVTKEAGAKQAETKQVETKQAETKQVETKQAEVNLLTQQPVKPELVMAESVKPNLANINPKTPEPVLSPQMRADVFQQLVQKAQLVVAGKNSDMIVQLKPEHLGKVSLQISVENGLVTAKFATQNHQVKEVIEANINNLKQSLTNQGLKLNQVSVHIGGEAGQPNWQRRQVPLPRRNNLKRGDQGYEEADYLETNAIAAVEYGQGIGPDGRVDYVV